MWDAFFRLGETAGLTAKLLLSTTSGIGLLLPTKTLTALEPCLEDFGATSEAATLLDYFRAHQYDTIEDAINGPRNWISELRENE